MKIKKKTTSKTSLVTTMPIQMRQISKMHLEPDDILIYEHNEPFISLELSQNIYASLRLLFPKNKIVILAQGQSIGFMRGAEMPDVLIELKNKNEQRKTK